MSSSRSELRVESTDPLAILEIANASYGLVAQGPGPIACQVPPGLYIVRAKHLDSAEERIVRVGSQDIAVRFEPGYTAPQQQWRSSEQSLGLQVEQSRRDQGTHWISIAIRASKGSKSSSEPAPINVSDFQVSKLDGSIIHKFVSGTQEQSRTDVASIGEAASVSMDAGWYALSLPNPGGARVLMPLYVCRGFSPTVFVSSRIGRGEPWIEYDRLLVSYDAREVNSLEDPMRLYAIESARRSLELGRNALTKPLMNVLLQQKFQDPILGLLAMQLLLLGASPKDRQGEEMFNMVSHNMATAFGTAAHPDLVLAREYARKNGWHVSSAEGDDDELVAPPLLRANWNAMLSLPARTKELSRKRSALYHVGQSLIRAGVWVVWKPSTRASRATDPAFFSESLKKSTSTDNVVLARPAGLAPRRDMVRRVRGPRTADGRLEETVDLVRAQPYLQAILKETLAANPSVGTVLDRTVARTVLQLAGFEFGSEQAVPKGYSKQMARSLTLPLPMVTDSISRVGSALKKQAGLGASEVDESFGPPKLDFD